MSDYPESQLSDAGKRKVRLLDEATGGAPAYLDHPYTIQQGYEIPAGSRVCVVYEERSLWLCVWFPGDTEPTMKFRVRM